MQLQLKQTVWVQCYPTTQNQVGFGAIYKFFDTEEGPAFQFYDEINGGFRIGLVKDVIENPKIVYGGGSPEAYVAMKLREWSKSLSGREQLAVEKIHQTETAAQRRFNIWATLFAVVLGIISFFLFKFIKVLVGLSLKRA